MASFFFDEEGGTDNTAFYAILNVPKEASPDDITKAYRKLAQVFHPDKHIDEAKRAQAQESFSKVQEAYEVLSDPQKRQIYDVYGKQGLRAGLEVGDHLRSRDELRKEWEEFQARQERQREEQSVVQKGLYQCRVDATGLVKGKGWAKGAPLFKSVVAQSALESVVGERNVVSVTGSAAVRPAYRRTPQGLEEVTLGGGNIMFGYRRVVSDDDTLELSAQVGLQALLSATSTRRLDKSCARDAWVSTSWSPQGGVGMQVGCSQALFHNMTGSVNCVLGPTGATGVATTITKRGGKYTLQGKLELGMVHSIQARGTLALGSTGVTLRAIARLGTTGIDLELGAAKRFSAAVTGYVGTQFGYPAGVLLKLRLTRQGQSLECPVLLSSRYDDWRVLAAAYVAPPLLYVATQKLVVRPALRWARNRAEAAARASQAEAVRAALARAASEQALIEGVARRKAAAEAVAASKPRGSVSGAAGAASTNAVTPRGAAPGGSGGLLILEAVYGVLGDYPGPVAEAAALPAAPAATAAGADTAGQGADQGTDAGQAPSQEPAPISTSSSSGGSGASPKPASSNNPPPQWLRVTTALQYLVGPDSKLNLAGGVPRSGLMGFADPAPHLTAPSTPSPASASASASGQAGAAGQAAQGEGGQQGAGTKQLYIAYMHQGVVYEVTVGDSDPLVLPAPGPGVATAAPTTAGGAPPTPGQQQGPQGQPQAPAQTVSATLVFDAARVSALKALARKHLGVEV